MKGVDPHIQVPRADEARVKRKRPAIVRTGKKIQKLQAGVSDVIKNPSFSPLLRLSPVASVVQRNAARSLRV